MFDSHNLKNCSVWLAVRLPDTAGHWQLGFYQKEYAVGNQPVSHRRYGGNYDLDLPGVLQNLEQEWRQSADMGHVRIVILLESCHLETRPNPADLINTDCHTPLYQNCYVYREPNKGLRQIKADIQRQLEIFIQRLPDVCVKKYPPAMLFCRIGQPAIDSAGLPRRGVNTGNGTSAAQMVSDSDSAACPDMLCLDHCEILQKTQVALADFLPHTSQSVWQATVAACRYWRTRHVAGTWIALCVMGMLMGIAGFFGSEGLKQYAKPATTVSTALSSNPASNPMVWNAWAQLMDRVVTQGHTWRAIHISTLANSHLRIRFIKTPESPAIFTMPTTSVNSKTPAASKTSTTPATSRNVDNCITAWDRQELICTLKPQLSRQSKDFHENSR